MPTIGVSEYVNEKLDKIKERNGHTSKDSVIRILLLRDFGTKVECGQYNCLSNKGGICQRIGESIEIFQGSCACKQFEQRPDITPVKLPEIKGEK